MSEKRDAAAGPVAWAVAALALAFLLSAAVSLWILRAHEPVVETPPSPAAPEVGPRLVTAAEEATDLAALRAEEAKVLDSYAWVDRDRRIARIPLARAEAILLEREARR